MIFLIYVITMIIVGVFLYLESTTCRHGINTRPAVRKTLERVSESQQNNLFTCEIMSPVYGAFSTQPCPSGHGDNQ